ncbi:JmjC-domain-containing protein [Backusella circina FSU 941]|nr:JmjC-domain-containing protein [Backusella circina FSU 941]
MTLTIKPSIYYDNNQEEGIPVFTPTLEEFKDFKAFMEAIEGYGKKSGIVKIIPPKEWKESLPDLKLEKVRVKEPITQHIYGAKGIFYQTNIEKRRSYTVEQWYNECHQDSNRPPQIKSDHTPTNNNEKKQSSIQNQHNGNSKLTKKERESKEIALAASDKSIPIHIELSDSNDYTPEYCKEVERHYWRNITFNQPMYGADMLGTLFDKSVHSWNVNSLENRLNNLNVTLPGVNSPYLYFGMWKATFPWHVEDMDLFSINYIHFGAPKQWYAIPPTFRKKFEDFMQRTFFTQHKACREFLRHKTSIVSPKVLFDNGIPVYRCVQQEGEFMVTFPFGYHSGYNLDFNCAESVNFALDSWLEIGRKAKSCSCTEDSVHIDVSCLEDITTPPSSVDDGEIEVLSKKRKRGQVEHDTTCILCPNTTSNYEIMTTDDEEPVHRMCAEAIPETYIEHNTVYGIKDIPAARRKLICLFCREKDGACMQCCYGKCWKSFHATCAMEADATMNTNGNKKGSLFDGYCPSHDPKRIQEKELEKAKYVQEMTQILRVNVEVYTKWRGGGRYKGKIIECLPQQNSCRVVLQDGITRKIPWRDITIDN